MRFDSHAELLSLRRRRAFDIAVFHVPLVICKGVPTWSWRRNASSRASGRCSADGCWSLFLNSHLLWHSDRSPLLAIFDFRHWNRFCVSEKWLWLRSLLWCWLLLVVCHAPDDGLTALVDRNMPYSDARLRTIKRFVLRY